MSGDPLAAMNSATLGTKMPVVTFPDGRKVQTGTVGALLVNIKTYDQLVHTNISDEAEAGEQHRTLKQIEELEAKFKAALPLLKMVGMFDLVRPEEWIGNGNSHSAGRRRVGELFLEAEREAAGSA